MSLNRILDTDAEIALLRLAYAEAAEHGTDPSTQNGAILVDRFAVPVAWGSNHFPRGVKESSERWQRPLKYSYVEHAERNAIFDAALRGVETNGLTMYCPWFACSDCARAIIQCGIDEVVGHKAIFDMTPDHWKDSIAIAIGMLDEAGVRHRLVDGVVGASIRFNGEMVSF